MTTEDFITELFCRIDDTLGVIAKHPQASLSPSEVVTLGMLFTIKGVGNRAFYRWLKRDWLGCFPDLPERTRLFRLFNTHHPLTRKLLAEPTILGVIDSYGIELIHPIREGRSPQQIGKKGLSNHRWIVGCKLCLMLNQFGLVVDWECDTANVSDTVFHPLIEKMKELMIVLGDSAFHARTGDPEYLKICPRGTWNQRMVVETVLSMLTTVCHLKKVAHRKWAYFKTRLAYMMSAFNLLIQWHGFQPDQNGFIPLTIADFNL